MSTIRGALKFAVLVATLVMVPTLMAAVSACPAQAPGPFRPGAVIVCACAPVKAASATARRAVNLRGGGGECLELFHDDFLMVYDFPHYTGSALRGKGVFASRTPARCLETVAHEFPCGNMHALSDRAFPLILLSLPVLHFQPRDDASLNRDPGSMYPTVVAMFSCPGKSLMPFSVYGTAPVSWKSLVSLLAGVVATGWRILCALVSVLLRRDARREIPANCCGVSFSPAQALLYP